jgi:hypothetical protein
VVSPSRERFTRGPRILSRARTKAPSIRRAGKEPVPEYNSDSDTAPGYASDSNPLFGLYSDSGYEFDFGSDPEDPESEDHSTEEPLLGPASGLVITSTPAGRFLYWPDRKSADLISGDSCYIAYLDSLPFQEGTPLARAEEYTPTEVESSDSSLGNPDRQVFKLVTIPPTWPFACWGLDMIGPLPTAPGGFNRVLVAIDKFTKWIEVKPVTCPKADRVLDFLDELVHRYGLPHRIITDLGSNFNNHLFWEYYENNGIDVPICLSCPSPGQRTSRARQRDGARRSQEAATRRC